MPRLRLLSAVAALLALTGAGAAAAMPPKQELATLLSAHEAFSQPTSGSKPLELVSRRRPLTLVRTTLPVLGERKDARGRGWLEVRLPGRPNGHTGWIKQVKTARSSTAWRLVVHTSTRLVVAYRHGRAVRTFKAVVGKPSTPTPHGQFFIEESLLLRPGDVGAPYALALSARSNVFQEFDGGPGQVALHGIAKLGGVLGTAASHGCVRLSSYAMQWLVERVGPGVPVTIMN